jgi:hypothetical protein
MGYGPRRVCRARHNNAINLVAKAALAGMKIEKHTSVSRRWKGPSHTIWSTTIDGVVIYRASIAALARIYLEMLQ